MDTPFPPETRVENEAGALMEKGHKVYLLHIDYKKDRPEQRAFRMVSARDLTHFTLLLPRRINPMGVVKVLIPLEANLTKGIFIDMNILTNRKRINGS